ASEIRPVSTNVITPSQAIEVVRDYWEANERAAMATDATLFEAIQTGPLLDADRGAVSASRALGRPGLRSPRPLRRVTPVVPHQRGYPARFLALIETVGVDGSGALTGEPRGFYDHFVKPSP